MGVCQFQGREDILDGLGGRDQSLHWHCLDLVTEANYHTDFLGLLKKAHPVRQPVYAALKPLLRHRPEGWGPHHVKPSPVRLAELSD